MMKKEMNVQSEGRNCSGQSGKNEPRQTSEATGNDEMGLVPIVWPLGNLEKPTPVDGVGWDTYNLEKPSEF
jgi:hypothetical protein